MAGFARYRCSRSVSPPRCVNGHKSIFQSANNSQVSMEITSDCIDGLSGTGYKTGYISPLRARTMKEYEQQISDLQKENFNLKLRLYFLEEKMEKNFDCDTRQLHEINIQLKIEGETMRKDLELKEKLLQEARTNLQKVEETYQKEIHEWIENFKKESNTLKDEDDQKEDVFQENLNVESEESMSELYKQAFGSDICSQAQTDTSESSHDSDRENRLEESMNTLEKLDQLHKEELSDLRATTREKQSSLENYVAKLKQHIEQKQTESDSKDSSTSTISEKGNIKNLSDTFNSKIVKNLFSTEEMCENCKINANRILEKKLDIMKKQSLKRDKTIQGLTEILYRKEKDLKYLRIKLGEKEAADQILKLFKQSINNSIIKAEVDQTVTDKLFLILKKYLCTYQKKEDSQISESNIELFEKYFLQWLTSIQNNCASKEESSIEETGDDIKKELDSLHQAVKDKNLFIQELLTERKTSTTENTKSMQNLLNNLKQKDVLIQDLKSKLEEFEKCANKENAVIKESNDLSQSKIEITKLNNIKDRLLNDNEMLKINHNKLKEDYEDILKQKNAEIQKFTEVSKKLQSQIRGLEQQIDEKVQIILKYEKEKNDLKEEEEKMNASSYEKQLELMREELECTRLELENSKLNNNHLQTKIIEKDQQFEMINRSYKEFQSEYEKIQNSLIEKDTLFCELKDKLLEMTEEFNKIKKIKKFESEELERLRNKEKISVSTKEKEIQELKSLLQEKTLLAEALNVELQLRENVAEQLHEGLYNKSINNHDHKITSTKNYSLNKFVSKLKRYSLPVYLETEKQYSKYLTQNLSNFGKSNDVYQLKEEICFLVLKIENLEYQIQEQNGNIGHRYSIVSGVSCVFPNSSLNRTTKTLNILHAHVEELANFLECLLRFDSDGQLDISLLTPNNVAKLKKYLADSKELSQSLSVSLWGEELSVVDNTLDLEPSKDVGRIKDSDEVEKIADEKTENLKNQMAECHAALQNKVLECDTLVQTKEMLENKLLECQEELALCREMLEKLKIQLEDKEKDYQKLLMAKDHLEVKDNENCALHKEVHRKLVGLSNLVENMQKRLTEEEKKVDIISLEKSELEQEINKKNQEIQEVQQLNFQLQNELKEKEIACKIFEDKFQNEIEAKKIISNNFEERLESEIRERKVMCNEFEEKLEKEIQERKLICQNYEEKLQNELKEKNLIFQDYQEIKTLLSSLQQNCIQLKSELEARIISEKNLLKEKTLLERDIYCKEEQLKDLAESLKNSEKELERKQSDWETKENENFICIKALQDERNGLNEKLQNTEKELLEIQNLHLDLKTQIQEFNMKLKNNKKEEFVKEMQYLRKELKRSLHSNKKLCDKMEKLQSYEQTVRVSNESDIPNCLTVSCFKRTSQLSTEILKDCTNISQKHKTKWRSCDNLSKGTDCSYITNYLPAAKELKLIKNIEDSTDQFHYTSPDQGIDSDPSQDLKIHKISDLNQKPIIEKELNATENLNLILHSKNQDYFIGQVLYAVCQLQDYELLKKEIEESLVLIKGIRARIKERLRTFSSKSSPGKSLEYSTLKEINSSSANLEAYLEECWHLIGLIWITTVPQIATENANNNDTPKKISLLDELAIAKHQIIELTKELTEAKDKINANQRRKEKMERAINTQLLKTRNVLKEAKGNLEKKLPENPSNKTQLCK